MSEPETYDVPAIPLLYVSEDDGPAVPVGVPDPTVDRSCMTAEQVADELKRDPVHGRRCHGVSPEGYVIFEIGPQSRSTSSMIFGQGTPVVVDWPGEPIHGATGRVQGVHVDETSQRFYILHGGRLADGSSYDAFSVRADKVRLDTEFA